MHGAGDAPPSAATAVVPVLEASTMNTLTKACHCCGTLVVMSHMEAIEARIEARVEILRRLCADRGWRIIAGDLVSESVAANLLGKSKGHLRNLRLGSRPIPCKRVLGSPMYTLEDLAGVLENCDE